MRNRKENHSKDKLFILQMTKLQFEDELNSFVNGSTLPTLIGWRILRRRRTEKERKQLSGMEPEHLDWEIISNVAEADSIKLIRDPFRGIALELKEKETDLWIVVSSEGDRESITVTEDGGFRHVGYKQIQVNPKARNALLAWLKSKQGTSGASTTKTKRKSNSLSSLDWFGLITGGIGLLADTVSLSVLFIAPNKPNQSENVSTWLIISFLAIIYTIGIVGFFSRRFFVTRNSRRKKRSQANFNTYKVTERSTLSLCLLIGLPLIMAYFVSVFTLFPDVHIFPVGAFNLPRPLTEGLYHGFFIGLFICFVINWITKVIYQAYAPEYRS